MNDVSGCCGAAYIIKKIAADKIIPHYREDDDDDSIVYSLRTQLTYLMG